MSFQQSSSELGNMPSIFAYGTGNAPTRSRSVPQASVSSGTTRRSSAFGSLAKSLRKKCEVDVVLDDGDGMIHSYSTFDQIKGHVELKFEKDTLIEDLHILFEGLSNTFVEKIATASPSAGRTTGRHVFLRMQQPIGQDELPEHNFAKAGTSYIFPFTFVVPDRLLPYICQHKVEHESVTKAHLNLPPSMGDPMLAGDGQVLMDDLAPEMSKILYSIKARVKKASPDTGRTTDIAEKSVRIRIIPASAEEPPLEIAEDNKSYYLRKEKNVRKGLFKIGKKLGRLTAETSQPQSLRLPHPLKKTNEPVTTMTSINLRFDPATADEQPPQLGSMHSKLKVYTFFGAAAYRFVPEVGRCDSWSNLHGHYPQNVELATRNIGSVNWTKHSPGPRKNSIARQHSAATTTSDPSDLTRRSSNLSALSDDSSSSSTASIPEASVNYDSSLPYYTAKVLVPVTLPSQPTSTEIVPQPGLAPISKTTKTLSRNTRKIVFVPSFNSCIVSRTYTLEMNLSFHPVNSSGATTNTLGAPSVRLRSPIQISQEGRNQETPGYSYSDEQARIMALAQLQSASDEHDEEMARRLDRQLNSNPFDNPFGTSELIPEYEEVQTTLPYGLPSRHDSIAVPRHQVQEQREQPPEYYSPFRNPGNGPGRRMSDFAHSWPASARTGE